MNDRHSLGDFLRARREQLSPEDVGLRSSGRRRTPGLRREEVATLAGVSVDYLTRLEQGRDVKPSASIVLALANALRLTEAERTHIGLLTAIGSSPELCPTAGPMHSQVAGNIVAILDQLDPVPAFLLGPALHVLAANEAWHTLVRPTGMLDSQPVNLAEFVFTHPRARDAFPEWSRVADESVGELRVADLRWGSDPAFADLLARLLTDDDFSRRWSAHAISVQHRGLTLLRHPEVGELRLRFETLQLPDHGEQRLISWFPADETTEASIKVALDATASERPPAHLRVVRGA